MKYEPCRINIRLLSINRKNDKNALEKFRYDLQQKLPNREYHFTKESRLKFTATFGMKRNKDLDNCIKIILDEMQRKYDFDDRCVYEIHIHKCDVRTYSQYNQEFIEWQLEKI